MVVVPEAGDDTNHESRPDGRQMYFVNKADRPDDMSILPFGSI
jgi:hypothetical protein